MPPTICRDGSFFAARLSLLASLISRQDPGSLSFSYSIPKHHGICSHKPVCRSYKSFTKQLADPANKLQCYVSQSNDPFLNLSIENHILRKSSIGSTVLFLYVNEPCVVIGRNQNPWYEVNLGLLNADSRVCPASDSQPLVVGPVELVRRRSGGGAVFHDKGNLNWSITCPRSSFTRDKHAEMVVRALRAQGIERARVNERHDIVLDQSQERKSHDPQDMHHTAFTVSDGMLPRALKISGSAYKLTRQRAQHHATTLLRSPNLHVIPQYLRSPAKNFIQAKGVESVSSPVANVCLDVEVFEQYVQDEFVAMYADSGPLKIMEIVGRECLNLSDIQKGYDELRTDEWMWMQTPQFDILLDLNDGTGPVMNVKHGIITSVDFDGLRFPTEVQEELRSVLIDRQLHSIQDWAAFLQDRLKNWNNQSAAFASRLEELIPSFRSAKP